MYTFLLITVISLSKGIKGQNEKSGQSFCVCVACYKLVVGKPALLHHLWSKQNYQALFVYRSDLGQNLCHFLPYFTYNSAVIPQNNLTTPNCTHSIQGDQSMHFLSRCTTTYKNENNVKHFYLEDSTILQDCSVRSIYSCVVCRVIMGFEQKLLKRSW